MLKSLSKAAYSTIVRRIDLRPSLLSPNLVANKQPRRSGAALHASSIINTMTYYSPAAIAAAIFPGKIIGENMDPNKKNRAALDKCSKLSPSNE